MKVLVLGAGLIGGPMAIDLVKSGNFDVSVADINSEALNKLTHHPLKRIETDLSRKENLLQTVSGFDLIVNSVPGHMGFNTLKHSSHISTLGTALSQSLPMKE